MPSMYITTYTSNKLCSVGLGLEDQQSTLIVEDVDVTQENC